MAEKEFESEDPMELVGTLMEADDEAIQEMGLTFIEELARMKWPREEIEAVFMDPFYRGPHTVLRAKGPAFVSLLIDSVMGPNQGKKSGRVLHVFNNIISEKLSEGGKPA